MAAVGGGSTSSPSSLSQPVRTNAVIKIATCTSADIASACPRKRSIHDRWSVTRAASAMN